MAPHRRPPVWSPVALADLVAIWNRYVKIAGRLTADKAARDVGIACRTLQERPFAGRARDEVRSGLRAIAAGPLVVFYRVGPEQGAEILRVLDRRKDIEETFGTEGERR
jgi:toxin ParE1/3/4